MAEDIHGLRLLLDRIGQMEQDVRHADRVLRVAGELVVTSVHKNFQQEGRPKKWTPLRPATIAARRRGKGRGGVKILQENIHLLGGIHKEVVAGGVKIATSPLPYARRQHFGYVGSMKMGWDRRAGRPTKSGGPGRGHAFTPARPYLMIQPEDITDIGNVFRRHIARK